MFENWEDPRPDLKNKTFEPDTKDIEGFAFGKYETLIQETLA